MILLAFQLSIFVRDEHCACFRTRTDILWGIKLAREFTVRFDEEGWLAANRDKVVEALRKLECLVLHPTEREFWYKAPSSQHEWRYDVRIFLEDNSLSIEISGSRESGRQCIGPLLNALGSMTSIHFEDPDNPDQGIEEL